MRLVVGSREIVLFPDGEGWRFVLQDSGRAVFLSKVFANRREAVETAFSLLQLLEA